jgi:hypothetical protein
MPRKGSTDDRDARLPSAPKRASRAATGLSFVVVIALACVATVVVVVWTMRSASRGQREHAGPATFRM